MLQLWFIANSLLWPFNIEISGLRLGLNVILLTLVGAVWIGKRWINNDISVAKYSVKVLVGFFIFLTFSYLVAINGTCTDKFQKFILTAPVLFFLIFVGLEVGWRATDNDWLKLQKAAPWILLVAFAGFIVEMLYPAGFPYQAGYRYQGKLSGLFSEPSAVAFSLFPSIAVLLVAESKKLRRTGMLALFFLLILSRSSTLIALAVCWFLYYQVLHGSIGRSVRYVIGGTIVLVLLAMTNYDFLMAPTVDRFAGVLAGHDETNNISSLVYLQGWQDAWSNLQRTNGLGLGFNMMGCNPLPVSVARDILDKSFRIELNSEDGSVIFGKLVSEAGVIGVIFFISITWWWIRLENEIHRRRGVASTFVVRIQTALIFSFVASSLVRSSGYFSGGLLLMVVAIVAGVKWRRDHIVRITE